MAARTLRIPRRLPERATIGIWGPSGRVDAPLLEQAAAHVSGLGHRVVVAPQTQNTWRYFAGTDDERLAGFDALLADDAIDAIMPARGGYGLSRIVHRIDWKRVAESGKIFVGFSDFTAFNMAAYARESLVTFQGPMFTSDFAGDEPNGFAQENFWPALQRDAHRIDAIESDHRYDPRRIEGPLWGGNLALLAHLAGTPYFPAIDGGILFVEEIGEQPYAVERMFLQLQHAGVLGRQRALILADFTDCTPGKTKRYPYSMEEVLDSLREWLPYPVLTGLPFGHVARKVTLPFGAPATLDIAEESFSLAFSGHVR